MAVENGGPPKPGDDREGSNWLIPERLADLSAQVADLRSSTDRRFESVDRRFDSLDRRWTWSLGLMGMMMLGLLAKLLLPGA